MKILLTNHQLAEYAGTEVYTYTLACALKRAGHSVVVYSRYIDIFADLFAAANIQLVYSLDKIKNQQFDIAHVHHNINALEVRQAFPNLPIFYLSHGSGTFLEFPPGININVTQYGAISQRVKKNLVAKGIQPQKITLLNNIVDETVFYSQAPLNAQPQRALIISNHMDRVTLTRIQAGCKKMNIELSGIGTVFGKTVQNHELPALINKADIVFTIGRGVLETLLCGRVPFILDRRGGDGLLTTKMFSYSARHHFNGLYLGKKFTTAQIVAELKKYDVHQAQRLQQKAVALFSSAACVTQLEKIYEQTIKHYSAQSLNQALLDYIVETVKVTRLHTFSRSEAVKKAGRKVRLSQFNLLKRLGQRNNFLYQG